MLNDSELETAFQNVRHGRADVAARAQAKIVADRAEWRCLLVEEERARQEADQKHATFQTQVNARMDQAERRISEAEQTVAIHRLLFDDAHEELDKLKVPRHDAGAEYTLAGRIREIGKRLAEAEAGVAMLRQTLASVEYTSSANGRAFCPWCGAMLLEGHRSSCGRQAALATDAGRAHLEADAKREALGRKLALWAGHLATCHYGKMVVVDADNECGTSACVTVAWRNCRSQPAPQGGWLPRSRTRELQVLRSGIERDGQDVYLS